MSSAGPTFGVELPAFGDLATPDVWTRIADVADAGQFSTVHMSDHVVFPAEIPADLYYGDPDFARVTNNVYDVFQVLTSIASTSDLRPVTDVVIPPYRNPVVLTKQVMTLSILSEGRFELGLAPGWLRTEFEVLGQSYEDRGAMTDEFLELFTRANAEGTLSFDGEFTSFEETGFYPTLDDETYPTIWIGGKSGASFRRLAEYGDGWTVSKTSPEEVADGLERIRAAWADYDRRGTPAVSAKVALDLRDGAEPSEYTLAGDVDDVRSAIREYVDAGVDNFTLGIADQSVDEFLDQLRTFDEAIIGTV